MLAWQLEHRDKLEQYRRYEELTGDQASEAASAPHLHSWNVWVWEAFMILTGSRQWTMGGAAGIPFSEIRAWMEWQHIVGEESEEFATLIRELDGKYLELTNKTSVQG